MKRILILLLISVVSFSVFAQDIPERPNPPRLVNDLADVLTDQEEQQLESELVQFDRSTTTQITIVTVPSLNGYDKSDFTFRLGEKWGVGQKDKNNGIVIVFKPKIGNEKGQVFIAIGYGLEGIIPDAIANREVVNMEMIPRFKENDIFGGLYAGTKVLMGLAAQEFTAQEYQEKAGGSEKSGGGAFFIVILAIIILISIFRGGRGGHYNSRGSSLPFWIAMGLLNSGSGRGSFGGFSGGSGGFGGGGGGFGGFGGGSFGGGGAGGSW